MQIQGSPGQPQRPQGPQQSGAAQPSSPIHPPRPLQRFQEMAQILRVSPEQAGEHLRKLFDYPGSGLTPVPRHQQQVFLERFAQPGRLPQVPENLEGLQIERLKVRARDGGPDWTLTKLGSFQQMSRELPCSQGGPDWNEVCDDQDQVHRWRRTSDPEDEHGPWTEIDDGQGRHKTRFRSQDGQLWQETLSDQGRYLYRPGAPASLIEEAVQSGQVAWSFQAPSLFGEVSPGESGHLEQALHMMPEAARLRLPTLYVVPVIGYWLAEGPESFPMAGLAGKDFLILQRASLQSLGTARFVLYHQAGHCLDASFESPPSQFLPHTGKQDFAELHRVVMECWEPLRRLSPADWAHQPYWEAKLHIFQLYQVPVPSAEEVRQAG